MGVDGIASMNTMLSFGTWRSGYCLECVWQAYKANGAWSDGASYPTAYSAWQGSRTQHPGDRNPPAGVPVYWGPKSSSSAGDVVISRGDGTVVATDWPYGGVIGICTIDQREQQIGRPYLGWTEDICGAPIDFPGGEDMDSNQAWQLQALYNTLIVFDNGSPQYSWAQASLNEIRAVEAGGIFYPGADYNAFQALANNQHAMNDQLNRILSILDPECEPLTLQRPDAAPPADTTPEPVAIEETTAV